MGIKIVINTCYGGFGLSQEGQDLFQILENLPDDQKVDVWGTPRDNASLVQVVEQLGAKAGGTIAKLKVVEIPSGVDWYVEEYDGAEWIAERHRTWS